MFVLGMWNVRFKLWLTGADYFSTVAEWKKVNYAWNVCDPKAETRSGDP